MDEYHDLYLKSDVLLLADVFENFRKTCLQYFKLDPCHYFTSPGLSWDAMLKMTNIKLELMTDVEMFQFIEKGMHGGVSYIANRHGKANNKYMNKYDEKVPSEYIMYLDTNNLYGWAMSQYLPTGNFKWMTDKEIRKIDLAKYKENGKKGLILEVDLEYPQELHNFFLFKTIYLFHFFQLTYSLYILSLFFYIFIFFYLHHHITITPHST